MEHSISGVGVLDKSVAILRALADGPLALAELVEATGISRPTAHRLASALVDHGLVRRTDDGRFALGADLVGLGHAATAGWPWREAAGPALVALVEATGESAQLYVREGDARRCVLSRESTHELRTIVPEGAPPRPRRGVGRPGPGRRRPGADGVDGIGDGGGPGGSSRSRSGPRAWRRSAPRCATARGGSSPRSASADRSSAPPADRGPATATAVVAAARRIEAALPR